MTGKANGFDKDDVAKWTPDYAFKHLREVFDQAFREHPEIMEPYVNMLAVDDRESQTEIMREGLRATIRQRYPLKGQT